MLSLDRMLSLGQFYALKGREWQEKSANFVTSTLHVFTFQMYALLGSTVSFVTPLIARRFDVLPEVLHEPILVSTAIGNNIRA